MSGNTPIQAMSNIAYISSIILVTIRVGKSYHDCIKRTMKLVKSLYLRIEGGGLLLDQPSFPTWHEESFHLVLIHSLHLVKICCAICHYHASSIYLTLNRFNCYNRINIWRTWGLETVIMVYYCIVSIV